MATPGHPAARHGEAAGGFGQHADAQAARVGEQSGAQGGGVEAPVLRCEQGTPGVGCDAGPALLQLGRLEPIAPQPGLPLLGDELVQGRRALLVEGEGRDPGVQESKVRSGGIFQGGREVLVEVAGPYGEREQILVGRLDLGREHAGGGAGGGGRVGAGREEGHAEPAQRGGTCAGGPDDTAADDGDVGRGV